MDIKSGRLALKYAQAFFNLHGSGLQEQDFWLIKQTARVLITQSSILSYFNALRPSERERFNHIFLNFFGLKNHFQSLLSLLQKHQRIELLPAILQAINELILAKNKQMFFNISTYPALLPAQTDQVLIYLKRVTGCDILYEASENTDLIAGLKLQSAQFLYNDTIQNRLQKIHRKLIRQN